MTLDDQRREFLAGLERDRTTARVTMAVEFLILSAAVVGLTAVGGYGLYAAAAAFRTWGDWTAVEKAVPALVGGPSAGLLYWVVLPLFGRLQDLARQFLAGERRATAFAARARCVAMSEFDQLLREYEPP